VKAPGPITGLNGHCLKFQEKSLILNDFYPCQPVSVAEDCFQKAAFGRFFHLGKWNSHLPNSAPPQVRALPQNKAKKDCRNQ
jgi:hypothetical protein